MTTYPGRPLCTDEEAHRRGYRGEDNARRRVVLRDTLVAFSAPGARDRYHQLARQNLARWRADCRGPQSTGQVLVLSGDWGQVTHMLTRTHGTCFAVLNMANAFVPGGAYVEGTVAQEENLFRRSDCHFHIREADYDRALDRYRPAMTRLISAVDGRVYLDTRQPRVCIRGPEDRTASDLGYPWLPEDQVFPFFELRAAAVDLRNGAPFDPEEARRRIRAQVDTLRAHGLRHAVLGAFGCGAFRNPATLVAPLYREEIDRCRSDFALIAFAIFNAGYGPDNYTPFAAALA